MDGKDSGYVFSHRDVDPTRYHPLFLSNGFWGVKSSIRGTDATVGFLGGLIDRTPGDVSRPAALPGANGIDCFNGAAWLNSGKLSPDVLRDYRRTLQLRTGVLETSYRWDEGGKVVAVTCATFVSRENPHLTVSSFALTPAQSGMMRFRFKLGRVAPQSQRLALAELSWSELKSVLSRSDATVESDDAPDERPEPPAEILTWFDLQAALASEGRSLRLGSPTDPTRAALWYPGEVDVDAAEVNAEQLVLALLGRARHGVAFGTAVSIEVPGSVVLVDITAHVEEMTAVLEFSAELEKGKTHTFVSYTSVSRAGWGNEPGADVARALASRERGWNAMMDGQRSASSPLWRAGIEIDGDPQLQQVVRAELFQLLQNTTQGFFGGIGACGLTPNYYGHVFWDADSWLFPVLLLLHPERARNIVDFRFRTLGWAMANAARRGLRGAMYPWEADAESGTEQTPRFAGVNGEREIMLNGCIAMAQWQYYQATLDRDWLKERGYPVISATADFWISRVIRHPDGVRYEILNVTSVDEKYTDVNNEAFTNAVARRNLEIAAKAAEVLGFPPDPRWLEVASGLEPPFCDAEQRHRVFDENVPHERRTWMAGALTFLSSPNLDWPMSPLVSLNNYRYALRKNEELSPEPNQMMQSMLSVHAAQLGDGDAALHWLTHGQEAFLKPPYRSRSETGGNNCTHHLAAGSGFLQSMLYGFSGLRITDDGLVEKYPPVLPSRWKSLVLRGLQFRGEAFDVRIDRNEAGTAVLSRSICGPRQSLEAPFHALVRNSGEVLDANWRGGYTVPSARLYPFQWNWDSGFIALGLACHRPERAIDEIRHQFSGQWKSGLLPQIVFHRDDPNYFPGPAVWGTDGLPEGPEGVRTSGIVQPPVFAFVIDRIAGTPFGQTDAWRQFEREIYPRVVAYHRYLYSRRDPRGEGLVYIQHNWEAGTDNSPPWDSVLESIDLGLTRDVSGMRRDIRAVSAEHRPSHDNYRRYIYLVDLFIRCGYDDTRIAAQSPFLIQDVLFNSLLARSNSALISIGRRLGEDTDEIQGWREKTEAAINGKLWDEKQGFYFSYDLRGDRPLPIKTSSGFMPLLAGIPARRQADRLADHLCRTFTRGAGWRMCASTAADEAAFDPVKYWRGPIWTNLNWMLYHGLRRYGFDDLAERVRSDTLELLSEAGLFEYFDPRPGPPQGLGSDRFSWSAALALDFIRNSNSL